MSNVKARMQSLGLLDRSFKATSDEELQTAIDALTGDHTDALQQFLGTDVTPESLREGVRGGRLDGGMETIAAVVTDACLADCIEQLGESADNPSSAQLREALPGLVERHGTGIVRVMLASTVAGEAPAAAIIRDLLKNDELVKLPKVEESSTAPVLTPQKRSDDAQADLRAQRKAARKAKQEAERARKAQAAGAKRKG